MNQRRPASHRHPGGRSPVRHYLSFLAQAAVAAALLAAAGWLPARHLAGEEGGAALLVACAVCWLGSAAGGVPVLLAARELRRTGEPGQPLVALFGASLARLTAVVGLALAAALSGLVAPVPLLVWTAVGYLGLLVVDTRYAVRATRAPETRTGTDPERRAAEDETLTNNAEPDGRDR